MKIHSIFNFIFNCQQLTLFIFHCMQGDDARLHSKATATSVPEIFTAQTWTYESHRWVASTTNCLRAGRILRHLLFIVACAHVSRVPPLPTVLVAGGEEKRRARCNSTRRRCWRRSTLRLSERGCPSGSFHISFYQRGASPLHEGENAEHLRKVSRLRDIAHHYNDEAEEWFGKYMKYKRHEETRISCLLQRHFPLSTSLATTLPKTRSSTFGTFRSVRGLLKQRKKRRDSKRKKLRSRRAPVAAEYLLNWLALEAKNARICQKTKPYA